MDDDFGAGQLGAQNPHHRRKPIHLIAGQEADRERRAGGLRGSPRGLAGRLDLQQRHASVIEEHSSRCGQFDPARTADQ